MRELLTRFNLKVLIVVTEQLDLQTAEELRQIGVSGVLEMPFTFPELAALLKTAFSH